MAFLMEAFKFTSWQVAVGDGYGQGRRQRGAHGAQAPGLAFGSCTSLAAICHATLPELTSTELFI